MLLLRPPVKRAGIPQSLKRPPVDLEVVIPAYNEEHRLPGTIDTTVRYLESRPWSSAVVVVDNNSVDNTLEVSRRPSASSVATYVIGCSERGKGAAVRRGVGTSTARYTGFVDADNATPISNLDAAMDLLGQGYGAVIGSRRTDGARYEAEQSLLRRGGSWMFHHVASHVLPDTADSQCGFKFFDGPLVRSVLPQCRIDGFAFDVEILAWILRSGEHIVEIPVHWSDVPQSTFSARRDGLRSMADVVRISLSRRSS